MLREKAVVDSLDLLTAVGRFDTFVRPPLTSLAVESGTPSRWEPGGPWQEQTQR